MKLSHVIYALLILFVACTRAGVDKTSTPQKLSLLNVSYDPTREFYDDYNKIFAAHWQSETGQEVEVQQSHGGSGKQARSVIDGLPADIVTLALAYDIAAIAEKSKLLPTTWQQRLPHNSSPYTSTMVFLVKKGNPKQIKDWDDLVKPGIAVVTPNPKTSGGARWNYLAAWAYAMKKWADESRAREFVKTLYKQVPVLDSGARGATTTFTQRGIGDVLITWENEAHLALKEFGADNFEIIMPSISILAEPTVALVDVNVDKKGTRAVAESYLDYLYAPEAQELAVKHYYRPTLAALLEKNSTVFPKIELVKLTSLYSSWQEVQKVHFSDGGIFDQIYLQ